MDCPYTEDGLWAHENDHRPVIDQYQEYGGPDGILGEPTRWCTVNGSVYRWIKDIIVDVSIQDTFAISQAAKKERSGLKSIIIAFHAEKATCIRGSECPSCLGGGQRFGIGCDIQTFGHAHVYHTCSFAGSQCRCAFNQGYKRLRRRGPVLSMSEFKAEYWENIIRYLCQGQRFLLYVQRDGIPLVAIDGNRIQNLPGFTSVYGRTSEGPLEAGEHERNNCNDAQWGRTAQNTETIDNSLEL